MNKEILKSRIDAVKDEILSVKGSCRECIHWRIEWDEYYNNSYCSLPSKGQCEFSYDKSEVNSKMRRVLRGDKVVLEELNQVLKEWIGSNLSEEYHQYIDGLEVRIKL